MTEEQKIKEKLEAIILTEINALIMNVTGLMSKLDDDEGANSLFTAYIGTKTRERLNRSRGE